jgi:DNA-binding beta-propeller fold protein YncE
MMRKTPFLAMLLLAACDPSKHCAESGVVCTIMGTGDAGLAFAGNVAAEEPLYWPSDVTIGPDANPWILDWNNHRIITLPKDGEDRVVKLVTGNAFVGDGPVDQSDTLPASQALWNHPTNVAFAPDGTFVFAAWHNSRVIGVDPEADKFWPVAGNGGRDFTGDGGDALLASFDLPSSVVWADDGSLYVSDQANQRIRVIKDGVVNTVVGCGEPKFCGDGGPALDGCLWNERSQDAEPAGRIALGGDKLYIADTNNHRIRVVDLVGGTIDTFAGDGDPDHVGDEGADPKSIGLSFPRDVKVGADGTVYVADTGHSCIRAIRDGAVTTVAGVCGESGFDGDFGPADQALLDSPLGFDVGDDGALWIADTKNQRLRRVQP